MEVDQQQLSTDSPVASAMDVPAVPSAPADDIFGHAGADECEAALRFVAELPQAFVDSGWWAIKCLKKNQLIAKFENNTALVRSIFDKITYLLDKYYVNADSYVKALCRENNVPEDQYETTRVPSIVDFRTKYAQAIKQNDFVTLPITDADLANLMVNLNSIFVGLCCYCIKFKRTSVANNMYRSCHLPMLVPFDHPVEKLFSKLTIRANDEYQRAVRDDVDELASIPYVFVSGHVVLVCETIDSRGVNSSGKKFKVLNILEPSASILTVHFNAYVRRLLPHLFVDSSIAPVMFVQLSESQTTPSVSCMDSYRSKNVQLVLANMANITMLKSRGSVIPQLHMWSNMKLTD